VTGVWAGNADSSPLAVKAESLTNAAPIWKSYMTSARSIMKDLPASFPVPTGIATPQISGLSGELPTECTPVAYRKSDVFLNERMPSQPDPACVQLEVDKVTGLLASDECPVEARELRSFFSPVEPLAARFPQWQASMQAWLAMRAGEYDPVAGTYSGSVLPLPLAPTEKCALSMTPGPSFQPRFDISVGSRIREVRAEIDGKPAGSERGAAAQRMTINVPRSIPEGGSHTLKLTVVDEYYNEASDEVTFRFEEDAGGPSVTLLHPRNAQK
jgi:membrane peptidoglycan carboxypeptidase